LLKQKGYFFISYGKGKFVATHLNNKQLDMARKSLDFVANNTLISLIVLGFKISFFLFQITIHLFIIVFYLIFVLLFLFPQVIFMFYQFLLKI